MSNENQETIADIVTAMLEFADTDSQTIGRDVLRRRIQHFARCFEAAHKREREAGADAAQICGEIGEMIGREETREKSSQVGNAAKTREALDAITRIDTRRLKRLLCELVEAEILDGGQINRTISAVEKARQALSAPPRNCDIGTPGEQSERFDAHCRKHMGCLTCPLREKDGGVPKHCELAWAQLPYEEGVAK